MRRFLSALLFLSALSAMAAAPDSAAALVTRGTLRPSMDTVLMQYRNGSVDPEDRNDRDYDDIGLGLGLPYAGVGFGVAVIDNLLIGGRLTLGYQNDEVEDFDLSRFTWGVLPYVEYVFLDGVVRPFVMGTLGFEGETGEQDNDDFKEFRFAFGGGGGAHFFIAPVFSIDATMLVWGRVGKGEWDYRGTVLRDYDYSVREFRIDTLFGLSGWF